mmetsp:Transcript_2335/g.5509  ORF Transcript_2335/g.5509 Transcript_2335/m.5509 type:complete len:207 (-) Transcript_2335:1266-1886(-)
MFHCPPSGRRAENTKGSRYRRGRAARCCAGCDSASPSLAPPRSCQLPGQRRIQRGRSEGSHGPAPMASSHCPSEGKPLCSSNSRGALSAPTSGSAKDRPCPPGPQRILAPQQLKNNHSSGSQSSHAALFHSPGSPQSLTIVRKHTKSISSSRQIPVHTLSESSACRPSPLMRRKPMPNRCTWRPHCLSRRNLQRIGRSKRRTEGQR